MPECGCAAYHTTRAAETLKGLGGRSFAAVGTYCTTCGTSYWSWLDPRQMSTFSDAIRATMTRRCSEAELRGTIEEMVRRAAMTGIPAGSIRTSVKRYREAGRDGAKKWWEFWK